MLYNPFHTFGADIPLKKLHYEFSFRTKDRKKELKARVVVSPVVYETKTDLILPVRGRVLVWDGHDYNAHHRRRDYLPFVKRGYGSNHARYSYDFVIVDEQGSPYKGRPRANDDWYSARPDNWDDYHSFGAPVFAAGAGRVVRVRDIKPDDRRFDEKEFETDENSPAGNYIVIDHLNGEFSVFGHLKQGSARVKVGQMVKQGDTIAAMGASGSSLFPHLHYELRSGPGIRNVEGLPSYFSNFRRILGSHSTSVKKGAINTGDLVDWQSSLPKD
jgi:murein DD-endopeptidase MepM/ murein hydrolase activator NlpD